MSGKRPRPATGGKPAAKPPAAPAAGKPVKKAEKRKVEDDYPSSGTESDDVDDLDLARHRSEGESEDDSSDSDGDDVVNIEFEFYDPRPIDFKSVRRLLEHFLPGEETTFDVSAMADAVVDQQALGTMVKVTDDPDVYAFTTILPINKHRVCCSLSRARRQIIAACTTL
jgi:hypothetical protein